MKEFYLERIRELEGILPVVKSRKSESKYNFILKTYRLNVRLLNYHCFYERKF